ATLARESISLETCVLAAVLEPAGAFLDQRPIPMPSTSTAAAATAQRSQGRSSMTCLLRRADSILFHISSRGVGSGEWYDLVASLSHCSNFGSSCWSIISPILLRSPTAPRAI